MAAHDRQSETELWAEIDTRTDRIIRHRLGEQIGDASRYERARAALHVEVEGWLEGWRHLMGPTTTIREQIEAISAALFRIENSGCSRW